MDTRQVFGGWEAGPYQCGQTCVQHNRPLSKDLFQVIPPSELQRSHQIRPHTISHSFVIVGAKETPAADVLRQTYFPPMK